MFIIGYAAAVATFMRSFPNIERRYDCAVTIILTFSLVAISDYQVDQIIQLAYQRLLTVLIGAIACVAISAFIFPVWAGQDLHNLAAENLEKLASVLEGFGDEFFGFPGDEGSVVASKNDKSFLQGYKSILDAKATKKSSVNTQQLKVLQFKVT
ncbi:aluminum-activated malate transporter 8-like isoform X2 [Olea europaea var. sylvestris]|uniref:aluminum-activated malate transporter 8-like isoform X2 n=1 Tax=Olea europaea var. sylvestris TaxID=158386 RepID=UPI000C1D2C21|nr:aluminum-activated malate transporter 8-like isoform X2 [Olea europaea var. sylvestris]